MYTLDPAYNFADPIQTVTKKNMKQNMNKIDIEALINKIKLDLQ